MMDATFTKLNFLILILFIQGFNSYGQTCDSTLCNCESGDMNPSGIMIGHNHPKGTWMFSYRYMNMQLGNNMAGTNKISDASVFQNYIMSPQSMNMDMHMLMAMYGITNRLSVMAMFNYNVQSMKMNMLPGTMQMNMNGMTMADMNATNMTTRTSGIGDTKLYATYLLLDKKNHQVMLSAGVNLPTGNIRLSGVSSDMMYSGQRLPYMMQLGSGTFDILPGVTYILKKNKFNWGTQVTGAIRPSYNSEGYCYGNELTANMWVAYRFLPWLSASARLEGYMIGNMYGRDPNLFEVMEPDSKPTNFGGKRVTSYAGLNIYFKKLANSRLSFEYGQPVYQNLNGIQLATRAGIYAGWVVSF